MLKIYNFFKNIKSYIIGLGFKIKLKIKITIKKIIKKIRKMAINFNQKIENSLKKDELVRMSGKNKDIKILKNVKKKIRKMKKNLIKITNKTENYLQNIYKKNENDNTKKNKINDK